MLARIFRPAKSAMQSGRAKTTVWTLEFAPNSIRAPDALMGWQQTRDMDGQIRLSFENKDEAIAYARGNKIPFEVIEPKDPKKIIKAYADNFAFGRKQPWTH